MENLSSEIFMKLWRAALQLPFVLTVPDLPMLLLDCMNVTTSYVSLFFLFPHTPRPCCNEYFTSDQIEK